LISCNTWAMRPGANTSVRAYCTVDVVGGHRQGPGIEVAQRHR
jgi:hypothetical protein